MMRVTFSPLDAKDETFGPFDCISATFQGPYAHVVDSNCATIRVVFRNGAIYNMWARDIDGMAKMEKDHVKYLEDSLKQAKKRLKSQDKSSSA